MRSAIQSVFNERTNSRDIIIEMIDARDDNPAGLDPGHFILQRFAAGSVAAGYREKGRISIQDYISQDVYKRQIPSHVDPFLRGAWRAEIPCTKSAESDGSQFLVLIFESQSSGIPLPAIGNSS